MRRTDRKTSRLTERLDRDTKRQNGKVVIEGNDLRTKCVRYKGIRYKGLFTIASTTMLLYSKDYV